MGNVTSPVEDLSYNTDEAMLAICYRDRIVVWKEAYKGISQNFRQEIHTEPFFRLVEFCLSSARVGGASQQRGRRTAPLYTVLPLAPVRRIVAVSYN